MDIYTLRVDVLFNARDAFTELLDLRKFLQHTFVAIIFKRASSELVKLHLRCCSSNPTQTSAAAAESTRTIHAVSATSTIHLEHTRVHMRTKPTQDAWWLHERTCSSFASCFRAAISRCSSSRRAPTAYSPVRRHVHGFMGVTRITWAQRETLQRTSSHQGNLAATMSAPGLHARVHRQEWRTLCRWRQSAPLDLRCVSAVLASRRPALTATHQDGARAQETTTVMPRVSCLMGVLPSAFGAAAQSHLSAVLLLQRAHFTRMMHHHDHR